MNKRILIYDDDEEILQLCSIILSKHGFHIIALSKCEDVLMDIQQHQPDLILMDLWIPDMGGEKAVTVIKQNPSTSTRPKILLFSANADIKNISEKVKADGYISKPFTISEIVNLINSGL